MTFLVPLDNNRVANVTANTRGGKQDLYAAAIQNPGNDTDIGWRVLAGQEQNQRRAEGGLYFQGLQTVLTGDASYSPSQSAVRLGAAGGLVFADGNLFATRRVEESFALAEVPGYPDVGIGLGSNVLARTNADGVALVPRLLPYMTNSVRIDPRELPINAEIDSIERNVVPSWRSAVKVVFPVRSGRGALLKIVLDDGEPAPAGAVVKLEGETEEFYVARRGEAFVTGMKPANQLRLRWKARECVVDVALPPENRDEITRVGPLPCRGVAR
jgi:outer membrane usher protein